MRSLAGRLPEAPTYWPTREEFADPVAYIASIAPEASAWGICRIVPPDGWAPPSSIPARLASQAKYKTRLQAVHSLSQGVPFPDGNIYSFCEYQAMAAAFKASK